MNSKSICTSAPGRICLFGEHQDYLDLPVIAAAISRRMFVSASSTSELKVHLDLPDIKSYEDFCLHSLPLKYTRKRDYFRSAFNVLLREGFRFSYGISGGVKSDIPVNSGTASSSALLINWLEILSYLSDTPKKLTTMELAELAYKAEVIEFDEPGGMMDHYTIAIGGIVYMQTFPKIHLESLAISLGNFVLGDSREPKDTIGTMKRIKYNTLRIIHQLQSLNPNFSLHTITTEEFNTYRNVLNKSDFNLMSGTIGNRDISYEAIALLRRSNKEKEFVDQSLLGQLLNEHNDNLREAQQILTPKINSMLDAALRAGALGGKINGSGGGGCMFVYSPNETENVVEAIERVGGRAYVVSIDEGILTY